MLWYFETFVYNEMELPKGENLFVSFEKYWQTLLFMYLFRNILNLFFETFGVDFEFTMISSVRIMHIYMILYIDRNKEIGKFRCTEL